VFKRVRFQVRKASDGAQIPWETTSLEDDFVFNSGIKKVVKLTEDQKEKQFDLEKADWDKIKESASADPFYAFVQKYPNGLLTGSAQSAIERLNEAKTKAFVDKTGAVVQTSAVANYVVGTTIDLVRTDSYTKAETLRRTNRVVSVKNGLVSYAGGGIGTTSGELVRRGGSFPLDYDPPLPQLPPDGLVVGKKWEARVGLTPGFGPSSGQKRWAEISGKVTSYETITVAAGTFKAYKVETEGMDAWGYRNKITYWIDPTLASTVKIIFEGRNVRGGNADRWIEEAISVTRGKPS
jgi:hypothetical protein